MQDCSCSVCSRVWQPHPVLTQTYIGDTVRLSGYCYTSPTVYLFLTGPNLPANGVALDNINSRADQGGFTEVRKR